MSLFNTNKDRKIDQLFSNAQLILDRLSLISHVLEFKVDLSDQVVDKDEIIVVSVVFLISLNLFYLGFGLSVFLLLSCLVDLTFYTKSSHRNGANIKKMPYTFCALSLLYKRTSAKMNIKITKQPKKKRCQENQRRNRDTQSVSP